MFNTHLFSCLMAAYMLSCRCPRPTSSLTTSAPSSPPNPHIVDNKGISTAVRCLVRCNVAWSFTWLCPKHNTRDRHTISTTKVFRCARVPCISLTFKLFLSRTIQLVKDLTILLLPPNLNEAKAFNTTNHQQGNTTQHQQHGSRAQSSS
jgi:hypothetical protein